MDLSEMEEQRCPDCHRPLMLVPVDQKQNTYVIHCACNRPEFIIPDGAIPAGIEGGPLFLYTKKS